MNRNVQLTKNTNKNKLVDLKSGKTLTGQNLGYDICIHTCVCVWMSWYTYIYIWENGRCNSVN
jgi:hypothetical protein